MNSVVSLVNKDELNGLHKDDYERLLEIRSKLLSSFTQKISVDDLAAEFGFSTSKLKRDFKTLFQTSIYRFYTHAKMDEAYRRPKTGNYSVMEVGYDLGYNGSQDVFVARLNADGSRVEYATYLGGSGYDWGIGITTEGVGGAYVTGYTSSANFPTSIGAYDPTHKDPKAQVTLNADRIRHWLGVGAVPTETVASLLKKHGIAK